VANLSESRPDLALDQIETALVRGFKETFGMEFEKGKVSEYEIEKTDELLRLKYESDAWNLQYSRLQSQS